MRKRKPGYYPKDQEKLGATDYLILALPLGAVTLLTFILVSTFASNTTSLWIAIPLTFAGSALVLACSIISSGSDTTDVIMSSLIMIALSLLLLPVIARAKAKVQSQKAQKMSIRQAPVQTGNKQN